MPKNILFFIKLLLLILLFLGKSNAIELSLIPLKKPILDNLTKEKKLTQGILKPKPKPIKEIKKEKITQEAVKPVKKPSNQSKKKITKIIKKENKKVIFLIPKSKPLIVKKTSTAKKTESKFYSQRDFNLAKKSIKAMEKRQWASALSLSKKAKDKSIYNYIQ